MKASTKASTPQRAGGTSSLRLLKADEMLQRMQETFDAIGRRAFEIFEANGRRLGRDLEDWLAAEAELLHPVHLEISEADESLTVRAEVPGFAEQDIQVSVEPRRLTISGKRETAEERTHGRMLYSERCSNRIFRVVELPLEVDAASSAVKAVYDQGVLTITLPLPKPRATPERKIKVVPKATPPGTPRLRA